MRNIHQDILKHWKTILIWIAGITAGSIIAIWNNTSATQTIKTTKLPENNWFITVPVILIMIAFIVVGYFAGKKIDGG